jgi:hypothetical protein
MAAVRQSPPVPTTSVYSRTDGIVAWRCSVNEVGPLAENIEVHASHVGMGMNPIALYASPTGWRRTRRTGAVRCQWRAALVLPHRRCRRPDMQVRANGIRLEVEDLGPRTGEPLVLIMGLGMQLVAWHEEFVQMLVASGFRVIRFDNRDIGLSDDFDHLGVPNLPLEAMKHAMGLPVRSPYGLVDMADDTAGLLDAWASGALTCAAPRWAAWWRSGWRCATRRASRA